jgi:hypothetical protein
MSRSVSVASGAFAVAYEDCGTFGYVTEDEEGKKLDEPHYDEVLAGMDWEDFISDKYDRLAKEFPSFSKCDKWLDNEDHAIAENRFAYFGMSEYMGLVSLWLVLKDDYDYDWQGNLRKHWAEQVRAKFLKRFGTLTKLGTFSNGEAVFERRKNEKS